MLHRYLFFILLLASSACAKKIQHIAEIETRNYRFDKISAGVDIESVKLIEPYKAQLDKTMNEVIGQNVEEMVKGKPNSALTNWFADMLHAQTQKVSKEEIDFAMQNYGGIRINSLAKGDITVGKIYELMPFDNIMFILTLDSAGVHQLCDKFVGAGGYPVSSSLHLEMDYGKASDIMIKGKPLTNRREYRIAVPDYIASGGDNMPMFQGRPSVNTGIFLRDMLITAVRETTASGQMIKADMTERIH